MARNKRYQIFSSPEGDLSQVAFYIMDFDSNNVIDAPTIFADLAYFDADTLMIKCEEFFNYYQDCAFVYSDDKISYIDDLNKFPFFPLGSKGKMYSSSLLVDMYNIPLVTDSSASSLNGNGCEFIDGIEVLVDGRETIYKITRSFYTIYADNAYIVCYDLQSIDGHKLTCPESLLNKYVAPTTTP